MADRRDPAATESTLRIADLDGPVCFEEWPGPAERTFVLLHGLGGSHLDWRLVAPGLAERGRVLAPDLPGFGLTPRAGRRSSILANRRVVSRFLEREATGDIVLAGNSMGGGLALLQAAFEPGSVAGVVPTNPVLPWALLPGSWASSPRPATVVLGGFALYRIPRVGDWFVRERFTRIDPERQVRLAFRLTTRDPSRIPEESIADHVELLRERREDPDAAPAFLEGARSIVRLVAPGERYRSALDAITCPVLLIHGIEDRFVPVALAQAASSTHPRWELRALPDIGHVAQMEAPGAWLSVIQRWLDDRVVG